jgi:ribonuclease HI
MPFTSKPAKKKYYVVWKGRKPGLYPTWDECAAQVNGFTGAEYMAFASRGEAQQALADRYADYKGARRDAPAPRPASAGTATWVRDSYCVDAACSGNPGLLEYRCVQAATRKLIFHQGPFQQGTNNIGEFLAIVDALVWLKEHGLPQPVYTDSKIGMLWVRLKKCKTKLAPNARNSSLFELIARAEDWLKANTCTTRILVWDTKAWGEIPADFGRK